MKMTLSPRFETKEDAIRWLRDNVPQYRHVYDLFLKIVNAPLLNGIAVFQKDVVDELEKLNVIPIWFGERIYEFKVKPRQLYWKVESDADEFLEEELDLDLEDYFAATSILTHLIDLNVSATYVFSSISEKQFLASLEIFTEKLQYLQAGLLKEAAKLMDNKQMLAIRGRHITLDRNERSFYVPKNEFNEIMVKPEIIKHTIVVYDDIAYAYIPKSAKKMLEKMNIHVKKVKKARFNTMKMILEHVDAEQDTVIGHLFRHPIIGYIGVGTIKPADIHGIGVPADIAEKLDGDDDGDIIDLIPSIVLKRKKEEFATTVLDLV